ncbi:LGFP repeat-containing protein [Nocardia sp. NPDC049149]|uniref:LGFP repeat-containing protein n=1 Tax=Nocardia sp. NPDC049149 TaxID=3364315 RepID=UPI003722785A
MARPTQRRRRRTALVTTTAAMAAVLATSVSTDLAAARPIGNFDVGGAIEVEYDQAGGPDVFGDPTSPESDAANGGKWQSFDRNAVIYWHPVTGAHQVGGPILDKWRNLGLENGVLRYPVTDEQSTPSKPGRFNHFQGGSIYWSVGTAAHQIGGAIRDKWASYGWESSPLGFPITDEAAAKDNGRYNLFNDGAIYWSPRYGAHVVWGAIRTTWEARAGANGAYGYPTGDEYDYEGGKAQEFQGGRITWKP